MTESIPAADTRSPIERARDILASCLADEFGEGITVTHDDMSGWQAWRDGKRIARASSGPGLRALVPYTDPGTTGGPYVA